MRATIGGAVRVISLVTSIRFAVFTNLGSAELPPSPCSAANYASLFFRALVANDGMFALETTYGVSTMRPRSSLLPKSFCAFAVVLPNSRRSDRSPAMR